MRRPRGTWRFGGERERRGREQGSSWDGTQCGDYKKRMMEWRLIFRMTDTGRPDEEGPIVPVGHKCGEIARRIRLTVHELPADRVWYLVLVQAYLEQGRVKGHRAWCHGVVVTKG